MSSLAASLAEAKNTRRGGSCSVTRLLAELDDVDRRALQNALDSDIEGETLASVLRDAKHPMSGYTIQRHRKRRCSCE